MPDVLGRPCRRDHPSGIDGHKMYRAEKEEWMLSQNRSGAIHVEGRERIVYVDKLAEKETDKSTPEAILAEAPADLQAIFDEYRREDEPFGATQRRIAGEWQALATRFGDDGAALDPLTPAERIKMHNLGRAVDWGKTRIIEVIGA
ncbi:hypothetical protein [uncultured Tateyamaria sp.]|uniref:hypothetical protein n=1 Tax=uncultured Tateyamaria sp. TaxID=455651 RepID=UPI00262DF88C|nr:hypothetical protein [uncultured Tateyamaria sp.]